MAMNEKTNAMRWLDSQHISYETHYFPPTIHSADGVAEALGLPASQVFKTLVVRREKGRPILVIAPGDRELDLRALARSVGEKTLAMASQRDAERITGLQVGGISALALMNKGFDVYIDRSAQKLDWLLVSAGKRGINLRLSVADLVKATRATYADATGEPAQAEE
jgi:Cys-tRNA(Pro)/Cys-tRNA(Cys) deacylase